MRTRPLSRLPSTATGALRDRSGSVATIFAVAMVPVLIAAGVGIDIARATSSRTALQDAIDATALAVAHLPASTSQDDLEAKALLWLNANLNNSALQNVQLDAALTNGEAVLTATAAVPTTLTAIAGFPTVPVKAASTVKWGLGHVEVALVLDNTGSMSGTKLSRLKAAAADLVTALSDSTDSNDPNALKISVVPFAAAVKVGSTYRGQTWLKGAAPKQYFEDNDLRNDLFNQKKQQNRFTLMDQINTAWGGCVESRPAPYDIDDTGPISSKPQSYFVPYFAPDEPDNNTIESGSWWPQYFTFPNNYLSDGTTGTNNWEDRQGRKQKYTGAPGNGGGPNKGCDMQSLVRLTTNMTTVKDKIAAMNATGNTNIPIGLMWGWHTLSPNQPFADGAAYDDPDTKKFVVLLTDGDNVNDATNNSNRSSYSALGYIWQKRLMGTDGVTPLDENSSASQRTAAMDARMLAACTNMKAKGVTVYTVRIDLSGSASTALRECATTPDMYYDIDSSGLGAAFSNIAGSIGRLRIAN